MVYSGVILSTISLIRARFHFSTPPCLCRSCLLLCFCSLAAHVAVCMRSPFHMIYLESLPQLLSISLSACSLRTILKPLPAGVSPPPDPRQPVSLSGDREPPPLSKILLATSVAASPQFRTYSRPVSSISSGNPLDYSHCTGAPLLQPWASDGGCKSATLLPDWQNRLWVHFWPFSTWSALHIVSPGYSTVCTADTCLDLLLTFLLVALTEFPFL